MDEVYEAIRERFNENARLVHLARELYREGDVKTHAVPFVTVDVEATEDKSTFRAVGFDGTATFTVNARGPTAAGALRIANEIMRTFHHKNWSGSLARIGTFSLRGKTSIGLAENLAKNTYRTEMLFTWSAELLAPAPIGI